MIANRSFQLTVLLTAASIITGGCSSLTLAPFTGSQAEDESALKESPEAKMFRALQTARESNSIVVQIEGDEKPLRVLPLPRDGKSVFMNDLVRQLGLNKGFGSPDMTLHRSGDNTWDGVKMAVLFDKKTDRVQTGTDYALRPGDRVTVRKDALSGIESMLNDLVPPVARQAAMQ